MDPRFAPAPPISPGAHRNLFVDDPAKPLQLTNLDKIYWPREGYTKGEMLEYYGAIGPYILPHLQGFPLVLVRYPDGIEGKHFYQKAAPDHRPPWLPTVAIGPSGHGCRITYCMAQDEKDLLWLANAGCIETHPWLSRIDNLDRPVVMAFDLDPHPSQPFDVVVDVALLLKEALDSFGLRSFPKTSGSSGIHVFVPLEPIYTYQEVRDCAVAAARLIAAVDPRVTLKRLIRERGDKLYLDCWQIGRGKTLAGVYSLRPQPGAPVSTPLDWGEVRRGLKPGDFHMKNILSRLKGSGDLFKPLLRLAQRLDSLLTLAYNKNLQ